MQMCVIVKVRCFIAFSINSQSKLKKFSTLFVRQLPRKTRYEISWWTLWVGDPRNFHNSFFAESYYLNSNFFQEWQSALLKNEKKNLKKDASQLKIAWHSKRHVEKRERKTKNEKKSNNNKYFFTFTFLCWKIYVLLRNIFG